MIDNCQLLTQIWVGFIGVCFAVGGKYPQSKTRLNNAMNLKFGT